MDLPHVSNRVEERLGLLLRVAEVLCLEDPSDFSRYSSTVSQLSADSLAAQKLLNRLKFIEYELQTHLASTRHEQRLVAKWTTRLETEQEEGESAAMIERRKEDLVRKAKEYHEELKTVLKTMPDAPRVTLTRYAEQENRNKAKEQDLKVKRAKIKAFKGLPPNLELARHELRNAQNELGNLTQLRERLLGRMAEGVS